MHVTKSFTNEWPLECLTLTVPVSISTPFQKNWPVWD